MSQIFRIFVKSLSEMLQRFFRDVCRDIAFPKIFEYLSNLLQRVFRNVALMSELLQGKFKSSQRFPKMLCSFLRDDSDNLQISFNDIKMFVLLKLEAFFP